MSGVVCSAVPAQDHQRVGCIAKFRGNVEVRRQRLAHLVGNHRVAAIDEQVGDGAVEVEKDRPGLAEDALDRFVVRCCRLGGRGRH
jgi:hypothetical protein